MHTRQLDNNLRVYKRLYRLRHSRRHYRLAIRDRTIFFGRLFVLSATRYYVALIYSPLSYSRHGNYTSSYKLLPYRVNKIFSRHRVVL